MNFDRHLISRAAHATRFHLHCGSDVFDRPLEKLQRLVSCFFTNLAQGVVESSLGNRTLAAPHDAVDELGHQRAVVNRIRQHLSSFSNSSSWHNASAISPLL